MQVESAGLGVLTAAPQELYLRRTMRQLMLAGLFTLSIASCSQITETRMIIAPARGADCPLEFVEADMEKMRPGGEWEVLGYVTIGKVGQMDPLDEKFRKIVRPRACKMGGEAIAVMTSATNNTAMGTGSGTVYGVLRRPQSGTQAPQSF